MSMEPILLHIPEYLQTARIMIRPPRPGDGERLYEAVAESLANLRRFPASLPWALRDQSVAVAEGYCREAYSNFVARRDLPWLLFLRDSGALVGASGLHRIDWSVPRFEVGWWGRTPCLGRGLITEGVGAVIAFAFDGLGARRVEALPDEQNVRSCRMCKRLGLELEGVLRHERVDPDGTPRNTCVYAKIR